jgi:hypothetical protein
MRIPDRLLAKLEDIAERAITSRRPDQVIGGWSNPYMLRWWLTPWRYIASIEAADRTRFQRFVDALRLPNAYVHEFWRSDDDRALHDHPWANVSIVLDGSYIEHTIDAGGIHQRKLRRAGDIVFRFAKRAHRIELVNGTAISLFITGFKTRSWGFHCPEQGWIPWRRFTNPLDGGSTIGPGCDG